MEEKKPEKLTYLLFILLFTVILFFAYDNSTPSHTSRGNLTPWQRVTVQGVGYISVPGHWVVTIQDDVIYMTDKPLDEQGYTIYSLGVIYDKGETVERDETLYSILGDFTYISTYQYMQYDADIWSRDTFEIDGIEVERFVIQLEDTHCLYLIVWDGTIDLERVIRIVRSFSKID